MEFLLLFVDSKLFLLINYTFYNNLNSTNFYIIYVKFKLKVGKLFLLINFTFYNNLNTTNLFMKFIFLFVESKLFLLINLIDYTFYGNLI